MNHSFVEKIIAEKIPCYFLSPHLDDAILSAGELIAHLSQHTQVEGITIVTSGSSKPYNLSAKQFLKQSGYKDARKLFEDRRSEDHRAYSIIGVTPQHLGYTDALWRKIERPNLLRRALSYIFPEFLYVYPTHRIHITRGKISPLDVRMTRTLGEELKKNINKEEKFYIFAPLAIKAHIDHVITRDVVLKSFPKENIVLWEDYPYNIAHPPTPEDFLPLAHEIFRFEGEREVKLRMIREYKSQVKAMFPDGNIPIKPEVYYAVKIDTPL